MRIAFIGPFALEPKRTMAVRALPLARALAKQGHQVRVVLPPWDHPQDSSKTWVDAGVAVVNVRLPVALPVVFHLILAWRLMYQALNFRPHVIHCFKPKGHSGLAAWLVWQAKRLGWLQCRLVVDTDDWEGPGGWNEIGGYSTLQRWFFAWQERWGLMHCDAVTVASRALQTIVWSLGVPPWRVTYVPNGAAPLAVTPDPDQTQALRLRLGLTAGPTALLYTRFFEFSVTRALHIMAQVVQGVPGVQWLVVGKGLFHEEDEFLRLAHDRGLSSHVTFTGWVAADDLAHYWALADVAIYPFDDTLINRCKCPVKLCELLAAGVPVVADAVGQIPEYIQDGVSGLLAPEGDSASFADAVIRLLNEREHAHNLGQKARQRMRKQFSWPPLADVLASAYEQAISSEGSRTSKGHLANSATGHSYTDRALHALGRLVWYWLPPLALMAFIYGLSASPTLPSMRSSSLDAALKKLSHVVIYAALFLLVLRALRHNLSHESALRWALLWVLLYAISDEVHQGFVPGRHANWYDVGFDLVGGVLFWSISSIVRRRTQPIHPSEDGLTVSKASP